MNRSETILLAQKFMQGFAERTGLDPAGPRPQRYLWTDAFAVCNYLGLFEATGEAGFQDLALNLITQVHQTLGRFRSDDPRAGWISGLPPGEAELHPTAGGLRIGKALPERAAGEPYDERKEWDRDGQYYHYLTKWMHALGLAGRVTGNTAYIGWAVELARTAHAGFTYPAGVQKRMYWKMSTDLSRPLVPSMGQHDPLDGLVTYACLQHAAVAGSGQQQVLGKEIADLAAMVRHMPLATDDPLGIGGLLSDAALIVRVADRDGSLDPGLLEPVLSAALEGVERFSRTRCLGLPAEYRLAFRELGLATGLAAVENLPEQIAEKPELYGEGSLRIRAERLGKFTPLKETITEFWLDERNQESGTWTEHREINTVMLATCLVPGVFPDARVTRRGSG